MKVALIGSGGYIAGYFIKRMQMNPEIKQVLKIDRSNAEDTFFLDLKSPERFHYSLLDGVEYVIVMAAVSSPDQCARHFEASWSINVSGTKYVIREALKRGCKVIFFSSDAVFGDIPGKIYVEEDGTDPATAYGRMKKSVEDAFKYEEGFKAIRLSYVVSARDRFTSYCLDCAERGEEAVIYHPFYRNCIAVTDVLDSAEWLMKRWNEFPSIFLNLAGRELVSRIRIADELNRMSGRFIKYRIVAPEPGFYQNRPPITQMKSRFLYKYQIIQDRSFTEMLRKEMEDIG